MLKAALEEKVTWRKRLWFAYLTLLVFWSFNAYVLLGKLLVEGKHFAYRSEEGTLHISDFINSYSAGLLARECLGKPVRVYDREVQDQLQRKLIAPVVPEKTFYFQYAPPMFLFCLPLSLLSTMPAAWIAWCLVCLAAELAMIRLAILPSFPSRFAKSTAVAAFLGSFPTWQSYRLGQPSLLLFPVILGYWHTLKQQRYVLAGIIACMVFAKVQYLPMVVAVGFAVGGLRFLAGFSASSLVLLGLCTAVLGWTNILEFPTAIFKYEASSQVMGVAAEQMQNLRGFLVLWFGDTATVHKITGACTIIAAIAMFITWKRVKVSTPQQFDMLAAITVLVMLVTSPHTHTQDYIMSLLPCAWIYSAAEHSQLSSRTKNTLKSLTISFPIVGWVFFLLLFLFQLIKIQPFAAWAIALAAYSIVVFRKLKPQTAE